MNLKVKFRKDDIRYMRGYKGTQKLFRKVISPLFCALMVNVLCFTNSVESFAANISVNPQEETKVVALLGDLRENVSFGVRNKLRQLVHKTETIATERESVGNYEMSEEEYTIWENITYLLDNETIRQFGECIYESGEGTYFDIDYGKETMTNLKKVLTKQDWNSLNQLRNDYFTAIEYEDVDYDIDTESEMKAIINKYKVLDGNAIILNLLDDKNQQNFGMFKITPKLDVILQNGSENGLKSLGPEEQDSLKNVWKQTTNILPKELFANFKYFKIGGDGKLGTFAYVMPLDSEGKSWCMTVDPADITNDGLFPYTLVHEMAHYITLNEKQVEYFNDEITFYPMDRYMDFKCVAREDSYLQAFYNMFWKDIINDWATNTDNPYFYYRHYSKFVTAYSSTECAEDLAECFSAYVFLDKAPTPETQAKLDFFDNYPELKALKKQIRNNIEKNKIYVNPQIEPIYDDLPSVA